MANREGQRLTRRLSAISETTLQRLSSIEHGYDTLAAAVAELEGSDLHACSLTELFAAKGQLAQLAGELDKLQFNKIDAVETAPLTSGKEAARKQRKGLTLEVEQLRLRVGSLHERVVAAIAEQSNEKTTTTTTTAFAESAERPKRRTGLGAMPGQGREAEGRVKASRRFSGAGAGARLGAGAGAGAAAARKEADSRAGAPLTSQDITRALMAIKQATPDKAARGHLKTLLLSGDAELCTLVRDAPPADLASRLAAHHEVRLGGERACLG